MKPLLSSVESRSGATIDLIATLDHEVTQVEALDRLLRELQGSGIWGTLGTITWARDAGDGLLLHWRPAEIATVRKPDLTLSAAA